MSSHARTLSALLWVVAAAGCSADHIELSVDVQTDLRTDEFDTVRTELSRGTIHVDGPDQTVTLPTPFALDSNTGFRAAEFNQLERGQYTLRVSLEQNGEAKLVRYGSVTLAENYGLLVTFSRVCLGVSCDAPTNCEGGRCEDPLADGGACTSDDDCVATLGDGCVSPRCSFGSCLCLCDESGDGTGCPKKESLCQDGEDNDFDGDVDCDDPDCLDQACDDGALCTENDVCTAEGTCEGAEVLCQTLGPCQSSTCDEATGQCVTRDLADGTPCPKDPLRCCGGQCKNLDSDEQHCGGCGIACRSGFACVMADGHATCDCSNNTPANSQCPPGQSCSTVYFVCTCVGDASCGAGVSCTERSGPDYCTYDL
ncbi:MAG: hypothetical protein KC416_01745 [Myxococcales bacterium]|nr:hypothetical protein [Myxococcales bacterium]